MPSETSPSFRSVGAVSSRVPDEPPRLGDEGLCEAWDWFPVAGDAVFLRCTRRGRVIREQHNGMVRHRCVCVLHGLATALGSLPASRS